MELDDARRALIAAALIDVRFQRFKGSRKAAYTAADVNPATWTRLESGQTVKETSLTQVLSRLFPRTNGDWRALFDDEGGLTLTPQELTGAETADQATPLPVRVDLAFDLINSISKQLLSIDGRLEQLEQRLNQSGGPGLSVVDDTVPDVAAADDQEQPAAGEAESYNEP